MGDFFRQHNGASYVTHDDAWRLFDDIYIDNSLARVIITDNAVYDNGTIHEPQIPISWSNNKITCTINFGRLPDQGPKYLFVFDSDNNHNPVGFAIGEDIPGKPSGLSVDP